MTKNVRQRLLSEDLYNHLVLHGVDYFCGVPDSLLNSFTSYLEANTQERHVIATNEGNAIGLAIGYFVATNKIPLVYMQNSGLGNAMDPLVSLVDPAVLGIPMILLIGWRGQPETKDEPQHTKQGAITIELLKSLSISYQILSRDSKKAEQQVVKASREALATNCPSALIVEKNTFADYGLEVNGGQKYPLSREEAIGIVLDGLNDSDVVVAGIGKISREVFEYRAHNHQQHDRDLLIIGGMGHASSIALGIAEQEPDKKIFCLEGDGSVLMHMGSLAIIGTRRVVNFRHIVLNNGLHDSVGGQPTAGLKISLPSIARDCGYTKALTVDDSISIRQALARTRRSAGSVMIEIMIHSGARDELIRPTIQPVNNKHSFMKFLKT